MNKLQCWNYWLFGTIEGMHMRSQSGGVSVVPLPVVPNSAPLTDYPPPSPGRFRVRCGGGVRIRCGVRIMQSDRDFNGGGGA